MKTLLFTTTIILCLMVGSILCQEEENSDGSFMDRLKAAIKNVMKAMKDIWLDFKEEMKARTSDMQDWSREMFDSFKKKMNEWINNSPDASESERDEMREYLERMEIESQ